MHRSYLRQRGDGRMVVDGFPKEAWLSRLFSKDLDVSQAWGEGKVCPGADELSKTA